MDFPFPAPLKMVERKHVKMETDACMLLECFSMMMLQMKICETNEHAKRG